MDSRNKEDALYCLNSSYNTAALQHVAVVAGLIVATFAYMGLSLKGDNPSWGWGSFGILTVLAFLIMYNLGRAHYYAVLTSLLKSQQISALFCPTLYSVSGELQTLLEKAAKKRLIYKTSYQFSRSFKPSALLISFLAGLAIALFLLELGYVVLLFDSSV